MIGDDLFTDREPGCDDDVDDEGELLPLGWLLVDPALADVRALELGLLADVAERMRAALAELLHGRGAQLGAQREHWLLLANGIVENMHGGVHRVWAGRDWVSRFNDPCKNGCRFCRNFARRAA